MTFTLSTAPSPAVNQIPYDVWYYTWVPGAGVYFVPPTSASTNTDAYTVKVETDKSVIVVASSPTGGWLTGAFGDTDVFDCAAVGGDLVLTAHDYRDDPTTPTVTMMLSCWKVNSNGTAVMGGNLALDYDVLEAFVYDSSTSTLFAYGYHFPPTTTEKIFTISVDPTTGALGSLVDTGSTYDLVAWNGQFMPSIFCQELPGHDGVSMVRQAGPTTTVVSSSPATVIRQPDDPSPADGAYVPGSTLTRAGGHWVQTWQDQGAVVMWQEYGGGLELDVPQHAELWEWSAGSGFTATNTWVPTGGDTLQAVGNFTSNWVWDMGDGTFAGVAIIYGVGNANIGYVIGFDIFGTSPEEHTVMATDRSAESIYVDPAGVHDGALYMLAQLDVNTTPQLEVHVWSPPGSDTVIRNLVINPSGEQSFDRAWNASNGTIETNVTWEV